MIRRFVNRNMLDKWGWGVGIADFFTAVDRSVIRPKWLRSVLHGTWLGHPLHPLLTDVPVGALTVALALDLLGIHDGANWATLLGAGGMVLAALAGFVDLDETDGKARQYGGIHASLMLVALGFYVFSLVIRFGYAPGTPYEATVIAALGYLFLVLGAYIGGDLVFTLGNMVDRHAWRSGGTKWVALDVTEVPERQPVKAKAGAQTLVLVRIGDAIHALHDSCAHAGCSLSEGKIVGDTIQCGCHGSRFTLADGNVVVGPATTDQPLFEVRRAEGKLEARRVR
ncbi:MAG TPA: Rieske 2Fe-2S domain-containing protein [Candidatus Limnocylindria bacterium]|nr:Rieske 2Fe-2S domain-containing protein [Candidatus Limnocylindria bacterium]